MCFGGFVFKTLDSVELATQLDEELYRAARDHYDKVRSVRRLSAEQTVEGVRYPPPPQYGNTLGVFMFELCRPSCDVCSSEKDPECITAATRVPFMSFQVMRVPAFLPDPL